MFNKALTGDFTDNVDIIIIIISKRERDSLYAIAVPSVCL